MSENYKLYLNSAKVIAEAKTVNNEMREILAESATLRRVCQMSRLALIKDREERANRIFGGGGLLSHKF